MPFLLIAKALFGRAFTFLRSLNVWQILCIGLVVTTLVSHAELKHTRKERDAYRHQRDEIRQQLADLAAASKLKQQQVRIKIEQGKTLIRTVEVKARQIETAPIPPGCKTSAEIMGSDL